MRSATPAWPKPSSPRTASRGPSRLHDGWTFHDGTPVTAESFVDAWNYAAYSPNAQAGSYFFANIEGYGDLQAPVDDAGEPTGEPAATELSGLRVVDDQTFTVTLSAPFAQFPVTLGYNPFFPLPESFFEDPEAFGLRPVGNGPFRADGDFVPGQGITVLAYEDFAGEQPASVEAVEFRVYTDTDTAYLDAQAGNLDVLPRIPADASGTAPEDFEGRYVETAASGFTFLGLPLYQERYADARVRQALSLAIDRETIAEQIFSGTRQAADSVVPPVVDGHRDGRLRLLRPRRRPGERAARRGRLRPHPADRAVVQRRFGQRGLDRGHRQPAAHATSASSSS